MLITGLPYDPTYFGKNTFLVFPMYASEYNTKGEAIPSDTTWFGGIYLKATDYNNKGEAVPSDSTWFGGIYLKATDYNNKGSAFSTDTIAYVDRASNPVIADATTTVLDVVQGTSVKGTRLHRKITFGNRPNFVEVEDLTLSFDVFAVLPVAPYAETEDEQGQTFELTFDNLTGSIVAPYALSEFIPRTTG